MLENVTLKKIYVYAGVYNFDYRPCTSISTTLHFLENLYTLCWTYQPAFFSAYFLLVLGLVFYLVFSLYRRRETKRRVPTIASPIQILKIQGTLLDVRIKICPTFCPLILPKIATLQKC